MAELKIVKDWGGFEKFIAQIHEDGDVIVQHNQTLTGKSGASRQIDIVVTVQKGPYEYLTLIECKFWNSSVKREQIDVLWASMQDLNASKGAFFTTKGFQKGAQKYAESKGISLYKVREITDDEWGKPGRVIDIFLQVIQRTVRNFVPEVNGIAAINGAKLPASDAPLPINISLGDDNSSCMIVSEHKKKYSTFEALITHHSLEVMNIYLANPPLINSGEECVRYLLYPVNLLFPKNIIIKQNSLLFKMPKISFEVGIKAHQSRIIVDRSSKLAYALAVVDCINKKTFAVSKALDQPKPIWTPLINHDKIQVQSGSDEKAIINGSILAVSIKNFFSPDEMDGLTPTELHRYDMMNSTAGY